MTKVPTVWEAAGAAQAGHLQKKEGKNSGVLSLMWCGHADNDEATVHSDCGLGAVLGVL